MHAHTHTYTCVCWWWWCVQVRALRQGCPLSGSVDCGAMTMGSDAAAKLQAMVERAVEQGARLLAGGRINTVKGCHGAFFQPTLLGALLLLVVVGGCLSVCLSVCLFVCLSVCVCVCVLFVCL